MTTTPATGTDADGGNTSQSSAGRPDSHHAGLTASRFMRTYGLVVAWAVLVAFFSIARPDDFPTIGNFSTLAGSQAVLVILTMGLLIPFSAGEFDISISGTASISLVMVGWLNVIHGWPVTLAIAAALGLGIVIGLINAFFVVWIGVDSIVVTLGMGTLLVGAGVGINNLTTAGVSQALSDAVRTNVFSIPLGFYYGLALTALVWYMFRYTPFGRYLYFVGAGRETARLSGIRVDAVRVMAFVASGFISAGAGVFMAGWLGASDPNISTTFLLPTFAAAFLGATAISPGRFNPWGSFIAVYFLATGITGLELLGLSGWIEQVFYGASLVLAVALSRLAAGGRGSP
ncbi:MAG TPA: ABC transporter permease [Gemmatimonadales bacterium]|nr:ABC transporter permease [Gemmatimonadales bacterium]